MNCILIDKDMFFDKILEEYGLTINLIEYKGLFTSFREVERFMSKIKIDIIFITINSFDLNSIGSFVNLQKEAEFVFIAENSNYALQGFNLGAADYLIKPVSNNRITQSILKCCKRNHLTSW